MTKRKSPIWTYPYLFLSLHTGSGVPYAVRVNMKKMVGLLWFLGIIFFTSLTGSMMFFRELEINRKLQERVLGIETERSLERYIAENQPLPPAEPTTAPETAPTTPAKTKAKAPPAPRAVAAKVTPPVEVAPAPPSELNSRIASFSTQCPAEVCTTKLSMVPSSPGLVEGELLIVLETEIPRIGSGTPNSNIRRRFFIYPGNTTRDTLEPSDIGKIKRKRYRFSRALTTTATFDVGKLLRPLAVNVYLFDANGNQTHHERRVLEKE